MVGVNGLEPSTPTMSRWCSNQLSYTPKMCVILAEFLDNASSFFKFFKKARISAILMAININRRLERAIGQLLHKLWH